MIPAAMHRQPATIILRARRIFTLVACAAVLLTSFEDEVLLAATISAASERGEAGALPPDGDNEAAFPDLSRSDNDERFQRFVARTVLTDWFLPRHSRHAGPATEFLSTRHETSLGLLYCVWRI